VETAVRSGGAMLDIFPSLHTALPTLFALHSFRHRQRRPYRQSWLLVSAAVVNIVIATLFLRWHYAVDVMAGVLLAVSAQRIAVFAWRREGERGSADGRQEVWERLAPSHMETEDFNYIAGLFMIHLTALLLAVSASWSTVLIQK
jgi:nicotinamide riboside transporter PnuC